MQLGTALNLPNPRINFGGTGRAPGKGNTAIFSFETGVLDSRINFSRTTNATITNSAGLITYAPHNLLTHSEQFDNAVWLKQRATITANAIIAPDGTITADKIVEDTTATSTHWAGNYGSQTITSGVPYTVSVYVKAAGRQYVTITGDVSSGRLGNGVQFSLIDGTVTKNTSSLPTTSTNIGTGWWRFSITATATSTGTCYPSFFIGSQITTAVNGQDSYTGDGVSGLYIWGAQLEAGTSPTTYNSTTVKNLLGYSELFDNAAWTKSNSFVQTNLLTYSEAFDNAVWNDLRNASISANSSIAPNSYQTADLLLENTSNTTHAIQRLTAATIANATPYTFSFYAKANGRNRISVAPDGASGNLGAGFTIFDLSTISVIASFSGTAIATIIDVGNGWRRCTITNTSTGLVASPAIGLATSNYSTTSAFNTYTGDGVSGVYIWGAQLVQGSVAGDYRRTDAAALPVYYPNNNGVVCAEKLVENTVNTFHVLTRSETVVNGGKYTISLYVKAGERTWVDIAPAGLVNGDCWFNLETGTKVSTGSAVTSADIFPAGNGWYRCTITYVSTSTSSGITVVPSQTGGVIAYQGDGTSGIYIFGAQLSDSASLDPYVLNAAAAPTASAYYGARFDYDPVTLQPKGLLIEEQRVNYCLWSEDFTQASWVKTTTTVTSNSAIAPSGNQTADTLSATADNAITKQAITTTAVAFTFSVYLKRKTGTGNIDISMDGTTFVTQTINSSTWTRCIVTQTGVAGTSNPSIRIATNGDEVYAWGAQVE